MKYTNKNLTVMFTDISGFTKQTGKTSRSDMMQRLAKHNALLLPVIKAWGGTLIKSIGDAFLLTFESPTDALHCALCLQHTLREYNQTAKETQKIHLKISVNSGEITLTDDDVFGDPVNVAAKIEKATQPGETRFHFKAHQKAGGLHHCRNLRYRGCIHFAVYPEGNRRPKCSSRINCSS